MRIEHHALTQGGSCGLPPITGLHFGPPGGRRALLQCGLHADEIPPMLVGHHLRRMLLALEAQGHLLGEVVLLPACNPIGLGQQVWGRMQGRFDLASGQNFNRHYPDLAAGAAARFAAGAQSLGADAVANTELLRAVLQEELAAQPATSDLLRLRQCLMRLALGADIVLDLHCDHEAVMHLYATPEHEDTARLLGRCLHAPLLLLAQESGDSPFDEAVSMVWPKLRARLGDRVPLAAFAATVELRGEADVAHTLAQADAQGLLDFLHSQGFVHGAGGPPATDWRCEVRALAASMPLQAPHAGLLVWRHAPGAWVGEGEVLAELIDPVSGHATPLCSPTQGLLFARVSQCWAAAGQSVAKVAGEQVRRRGKLLSA